MKKYKITNCEHFDDYFWECPSCNIGYLDCQSIKDCELKKIIEQCKHSKSIDKSVAQKILSMVKIEEVEDLR